VAVHGSELRMAHGGAVRAPLPEGVVTFPADRCGGIVSALGAGPILDAGGDAAPRRARARRHCRPLSFRWR
jgi:hypothetical protein